MTQPVSKLLAERWVGGFHVTQREYPGGISMPRHGHGPASVSFVLAGGFEEQVGERTHEVGAPFMVFHPRGKEHAVRFGSVTTNILNVEVTSGVADGLSSWPTEPTYRSHADIVARISRELHHPDEFSDLSIQALSLELLVRLNRENRRPLKENAISRATAYMRQHFKEALSIETLAGVCGMHPTAFARAFRRETGQTVGEHLRSLRIAYAAELITRSTRPLGEIAVECGFADQSHMTRTFKLHAGVTPSRLRG